MQSDVTIPGILPECSGYVTAAEIAVSRQFNASLISISSTNSVTSSTLAVALASATSALASVQLSALAALRFVFFVSCMFLVREKETTEKRGS